MKGIKAMAVPMTRATALDLHHQQLLLPLQHQIELAPAAARVGNTASGDTRLSDQAFLDAIQRTFGGVSFGS